MRNTRVPGCRRFLPSDSSVRSLTYLAYRTVYKALGASWPPLVRVTEQWRLNPEVRTGRDKVLWPEGSWVGPQTLAFGQPEVAGGRGGGGEATPAPVSEPESAFCPLPRLKATATCCCCWVASVVSDSVRPHRQQPTRLRRPWDSPGKNTGVGCHFLLRRQPECFLILKNKQTNKKNTAILGSCNSYSIHFTRLTCTVQWFLVYSKVVQSLSISNPRRVPILSLPKETPCIGSHFLFVPPLSLWQQLIYFLPWWIHLFWRFHVKGIIQYVLFYVWLLIFRIMCSRFVYVVTYISISFLFMAAWYSVAWLYTTFVYPFSSWWTFGLF